MPWERIAERTSAEYFSGLDGDQALGHGFLHKLGKEYDKAAHCHPAYLTSMQSTSCEIPERMKHKLDRKSVV